MSRATELLKSAIPNYAITLPLSKDKIKYRPFLVKEEKILLLALEEDKEEAILGAIKIMIESCCENINDAGEIPFLDLEYLFLNIRAKSIGEVVTPVINDQETGERIKVEIDLHKIKPKIKKDFSNKIKINEDVGVLLKPPTLNMTYEMQKNPEMYYHDNTGNLTINGLMHVLKSCIIEIYTKEDSISTGDMTDEEILDFLEVLTPEQFSNINEYFDSIPELSTTVNYTLSDGTEKTFVIKGIENFFA